MQERGGCEVTHTTPEQARKIARELDDQNSSIDKAARIALRSLATQLEAVTAENESFQVGFSKAWFALKKAGVHPGRTDDHLHEVIGWLAAERDAYKLDAQRYRWLRHGDNDEKVLCNGPVDKDYWYLLRNKKLDDAIDEAIAKEKTT